MYKKNLKRVVAVVLSSVLLLSGCGSNAGNQEDTKDNVKTETESKTQEEKKSERTGEEVSTLDVAENIQLKYEESELYEYTDPMIGIARDEKIEKQMGFDIKGGMFENYTELFEVYQDPELTQSANAYFEWDETTQVLKIKPSKYKIGAISSTDMDQDVPGNDGVSHYLFEKGECMDWGNLPQYYLVQYVDENTGEALDKPIVTVFTVKHELEQKVKLKVRIDEEGIPQFSWTKVEGATNYYILRIDYTEEKGYDSYSYVVDSTTENYWTPEDTYIF